MPSTLGTEHFCQLPNFRHNADFRASDILLGRSNDACHSEMQQAKVLQLRAVVRNLIPPVAWLRAANTTGGSASFT
jgi:hypothetical protein